MKRFLLAYFFFSFFFFTFFASGFVDSQDGFQYVAVARRFYYDRTFEMPRESFATEENIHMSTAVGREGKIFSPTGLGYTLSLMPAVMIEDLFLRFSGQQPITAFPLQNDWPVLLFASMTNSLWGALFVVTLYSYLRDLTVRHYEALGLSLGLTLATNVVPYIKHTFAQMMFTSSMFLSFLLLRKYVTSNRYIFILAAGFWFGVMVISYNPTYVLPLPAFGLYYLALNYSKVKLKTLFLVQIIKDALLALLGALPMLILYTWFNHLRLGGTLNTGYRGGLDQVLNTTKYAYVIIEGIWGLLFSPGKSIFLYSPILLIIIFFWFKIKKSVRPELIAGSTLFLTYLWNMGTLLGGYDFLVWHGDSSWGPRYMLPTLPLLLVITGYLFTQLTKKEKLITFYPLLALGIFINGLVLLLPYQIRFAGLQTDAFFNNRNFNVYEYGNEIPRYAPAFKLTKILVHRIKNIKQTYSHGPYNLRLIDGFDYPFDLGWMVWRGVRPYAVVQFDAPTDKPIESISLQIKNHQMQPNGTQSVHFSFTLNGESLPFRGESVASLSADTEQEFKFDTTQFALKPRANTLTLESSFESSTAAQIKQDQTLFLQIARINDLPQNIETIDYPYVSPISQGLKDIEYHYWGGQEKNPWAIWHMHSGVYEQTFDLWWTRPLHYWDLPKDFFLALGMINLLGLTYTGWYLIYLKP